MRSIGKKKEGNSVRVGERPRRTTAQKGQTRAE